MTNPVTCAREYLGLTESGVLALHVGCSTGKVLEGVAAEKLIRDGHAKRFDFRAYGGGRPIKPTDKGREAMRVMTAVGWRPPRPAGKRRPTGR